MVGEFDDSALMQAFGAAGAGVFPAPSALEQSLTQEGQLQVLGRVDSVSEQFFAISAEKRITHPAVKAITENAEQFLQKKQLGK
jgi:LysR family transcriptional activator of nhaA